MHNDAGSIKWLNIVGSLRALTIYHIGAHKCPLKPDTNKYRKQVRDALLRNSGLDAHGIQQAEVGQTVVDSDIKEAWKRAMQLSYTNIRSEKANVAYERTPDKCSLEAVGILKQVMDREDKYLIYKINNLQFNRQPYYVFTSSTPMTHLVIDMDQDVPKHPTQGEKAYFDGCHSQYVGYKTLALFVNHPAMWPIFTLLWGLKMSPHVK